MKKMFNSSAAVTLTAALFLAGCAGISDANLSEVESNEADAQIINEADFQNQRSATAQNNDEVIFRGGDVPDIIIIKPETDDDR